ncbi:YtzH-like family protein [Shouchella lonarensis]|uniref:YtzH-like protein n=1 Tax=Shouchella lonarensis TaxID=1464122 RepID=A0A1G6GGS6_9BACI|nr:YtzH-like family protein [Shouchella lonarensis]SDB81154.1 YtzH-like protein [Shouchella lonarensis]
MPISVEQKLGLLRDLLQNRQSEQYFTANEQIQLQQLATILMHEPTLNSSLSQTLQTIASTTGSENVEDTAVQQWLSTLDNTEYS